MKKKIVLSLAGATNAADLQRTLEEMELSLVMCTAMSPHCGKVNIFPGFSEMISYACQECRRAVESDDENRNVRSCRRK